MNQAPRWLGMAITAWIALLLAIVMTSACYLAVGATLGIFFGGIVFAAILVPPLCLAEDGLADRLMIAACVNDGIGAVWLVAVFTSPVTLVQWLLCYALLIAWCFALLGLTILIGHSRDATRRASAEDARHVAPRLFSPIPAAAATITIALAWLTCPIWLSHLHSAWFVPTHPLFALNGVLKNLGFWTERPLAYRYLLNLGQDVPYELPASIWPAAATQIVIGLLGMGLSRVVGRR